MKRWGSVVAVLVSLTAGLASWWLTRPSELPARFVEPRPLPAPPNLRPATLTPRSPTGARTGVQVTVLVLEDESSAPLPGARVAWVDRRAGRDDLLAQWRADEHGRLVVEVDAPEAGLQQALQATAEGHVWSPPVALGPSTVHDVTLRCRRGAAVEGRVVDTRGAPLPGIEVTAHSQAGAEAGPPQRVQAARTDSDGRFVLWLVPGRAWVRAGGGLWVYTEREVMAPGGPLSLVLTLGGGLRGAVVHANGAPGARARIALGGTEVGEADEGGRFEFDGLGEPALLLEAVDPAARERSAPVEVRPRAGVWTELTLLLEPTLGLEGVVVDHAGRPAEGAALHLRPVASADAQPLGEPTKATGWTDAGGEFWLDTGAVEPTALVELVAWTPLERGRVVTHPGERVRLALAPRELVTGRLTGPDGASLPVFDVRQRAGEAKVRDELGRFSFERSALGPSVTFRAPGLSPRTLALPDAGVDLGTVSLGPVYRVRLEVFLDGGPAPQVWVGPPSAAREDGDGGLVLEAERPGERVWVDGEFAPKQVTVGPEDPVRVDVEAGGTLVLRCTPAADSSLTLITLESCRRPLPSPVVRPGATERGLVLSHLGENHCTLLVHAGALEGTLETDLPGSGTREVELDLKLAEHLGSAVVDDLPQPRRRR